MQLGKLQCVSAFDRPELLGATTAKVISKIDSQDVWIAEIDSTFSDTAAFCQNYQVPLTQTVNCVILEASRADKTWLAACLVLGSTRADVNGLARRTLSARKVSFALQDRAVAEVKMEYGAIGPIGLPEGMPILIDKVVVDCDYVVIGSGIRKSKLILPGKILAELPNVVILENLGR